MRRRRPEERLMHARWLAVLLVNLVAVAEMAAHAVLE
jgi:hypothetical protein